MFGAEEERITDNSVLRSLNLVYLICLSFNGHILMNNADTSLSCHCDGHTMFGNSVHARTHKGNVESDLLGEVSVKVYLIRNDFRVRRDQKHVVKCDTVFNYLCHDLPFRSESANDNL